jgi:hypothetical protein
METSILAVHTSTGFLLDFLAARLFLYLYTHTYLLQCALDRCRVACSKFICNHTISGCLD